MWRGLSCLNNSRMLLFWIRKDQNWPGMVAHTSNPSSWETEAGRLQVWSQAELHSETLSQKKQNSLPWWLVPIILATQAEVRRSMVWRQIVHETLSQKKIHHKKGAVGVAQTIARLPSKCEAEFKKKKKVQNWRGNSGKVALLSLVFCFCKLKILSRKYWPTYLGNHLACSFQGSSPSSQFPKHPPQEKHCTLSLLPMYEREHFDCSAMAPEGSPWEWSYSRVPAVPWPLWLNLHPRGYFLSLEPHPARG
jgi:hypothetical protein